MARDNDELNSSWISTVLLSAAVLARASTAHLPSSRYAEYVAYTTVTHVSYSLLKILSCRMEMRFVYFADLRKLLASYSDKHQWRIQDFGKWRGVRVERRRREGRGAEWVDVRGETVGFGEWDVLPPPKKFQFCEWKWRVLMHPGTLS